jgi:hypothetical protein
MAKQMVWLSGLVPYQLASAVLQRIGHVLIPASSVWEQTRYYGERLEETMKESQRWVSPERVQLAPASQDHARPLGVGMDGGMVHIRGEGWKEIKVGTVFEVEQRLQRDPRTADLVEQAHAVHATYTAVLGSVEDFSPALWSLAVEAGLPSAADSSVTADGAAWIWSLTADLFPDSVQIVDWFHACDHLAEAASALYPDDPAAAQRWLHQKQDDLFQGNLAAITRPLDEAGLPELSHYFHTHQRRMQYQEFREQGYPIGSGQTESTVKQFKARLSDPGMRWSRSAAQQMLIIRAAVLSDTFDSLWLLAP